MCFTIISVDLHKRDDFAAAKHMEPQSQKDFCQAAGVMCMGEVYSNAAQ